MLSLTCIKRQRFTRALGIKSNFLWLICPALHDLVPNSISSLVPSTLSSLLLPQLLRCPQIHASALLDASPTFLKAAVLSLTSTRLVSLPSPCQANDSCSSGPNGDGTFFPDASPQAGRLFSVPQQRYPSPFIPAR